MDIKVDALRTNALGDGGRTDSGRGLEPVGLVGGNAGIADGLGEADLLWYWGSVSYTRLSRVGRPRTRTTAGVVPACYLPLPYLLQVAARVDKRRWVTHEGDARRRPLLLLAAIALAEGECGEEQRYEGEEEEVDVGLVVGDVLFELELGRPSVPTRVAESQAELLAGAT